MFKTLSISILLLLSTLGYAQRNEIKGKLNDDLGFVVDAHIVNTTSGQGTFSRLNGEFLLKIKENDVIKITSIQHHSVEFTFQKSLVKNGILSIFLHLKNHILDEVEVKKTELLGNLSSDSKHIKKSKEQEIVEKLGFNPFPKKMAKIDREIKTAYAGGIKIGLGAIVSVDYLINSISGKIDRLEKQKELLENDKKLQYIENTYKNYIITKLKIDSTSVSRFIYFCHFDEKFQETYAKGELSIIPFLKQKAEIFRKDTEK